MQGAGDLIVVTCPQGNDVEVTVPEGISAGDVFFIIVEAASADAEPQPEQVAAASGQQAAAKQQERERDAEAAGTKVSLSA